MIYKIILTDNFKKEAKRLIKKYGSLKYELEGLGEELATNPTLGIPLGNNVYKVRLAIASKKSGKSAGARVITYVQLDEDSILLLSIYNKGEKDTISDKEIKSLISEYLRK